MLSINEVAAVLTRNGFVHRPKPGKKVHQYEHPRLQEPVYIKQSQSLNPRIKTPLVLHPRHESLDKGASMSDGYYFNSNLEGFPKRFNTGKTEEAYGLALGFSAPADLDSLLSQLLGIAAPPSVYDPACGTGGMLSELGMHLGEVDPSTAHFLREDVATTETECQALIKARIGQGVYRNSLVSYWGGCAVTGCTNLAMLRASHAKPWHTASPVERLDPFNGLLLVPNLDLAFDQGLISFDDQGGILVSRDLDTSSACVLGINPHLRLRQIAVRHSTYLAWHRDHLFRK